MEHTGMVCADLECLIAPHHQTDLLRLLVREKTDIACASFLPLCGLGREPEQLGTPG